MTKFLSTAKLRVFRMLCAHDVDVRTVGFAVFFGSCRAIQGGFLLLAMLCSYLVSDTWSLPSLSRSTDRGRTREHSLMSYYGTRQRTISYELSLYGKLEAV
jgi:hypothetical protein